MTFDELIERIGDLFIQPDAYAERRKDYPVLTIKQQRVRKIKEVLCSPDKTVKLSDYSVTNGYHRSLRKLNRARKLSNNDS